MCCRVRFQVHAVNVRELLLFLVLNRISRNSSSFLLSRLLVSCHILIVFAFFLFIMEVCFPFKKKKGFSLQSTLVCLWVCFSVQLCPFCCGNTYSRRKIFVV